MARRGGSSTPEWIHIPEEEWGTVKEEALGRINILLVKLLWRPTWERVELQIWRQVQARVYYQVRVQILAQTGEKRYAA